MSKEISLISNCPHLIVEERVPLSDNRRVLAPAQPISSHLSVQIMANDDPDLIIPQGGLSIPAQITGAVSGPFNIKRGFEQLSLRTEGTQVNVPLPIGARVTTDAIVARIKTTGTQLFVGNAGGFLFFADNNQSGLASRIRVDGTAAPFVGFSDQVGARGKDLFPSWQLARLVGTDTRSILFTKPVKNNPLLKVTYAALRERCLRCGASLIENDWTFDTAGQVFLIENEDLLHQAAVKIVFTEKGSNVFQTFYGTELLSSIGSKMVGAVSAQINEDVRRALRTMQQLQKEQRKYQLITDKEQLLRIDYVRTTPSEEDLTAFDVQVGLRNAANQPVHLNVFFTVPQVVSRMVERQLNL